MIHGGAGDDILVGGKGRDRLYGDGGDDTYTWNLGDGNDVIMDAEGRNKLKFGTGIDRTMVKVVPYGMDLVVILAEYAAAPIDVGHAVRSGR